MTINRDDRNALYSALVLDLSGLDDVYKLLDEGRGEEAQADRQRFEADWRLMDHLGWDAEDPRERFELTMPRDHVEPLIRRLLIDAQTSLVTLRSPEDEIEIDEELALLTTCRHVLGELEAEVPPPRQPGGVPARTAREPEQETGGPGSAGRQGRMTRIRALMRATRNGRHPGQVG